MASREQIKARRATVRDLYASGMPLADIALSLGVHISTVCRDVQLLAERGLVEWRTRRHG